MKSSHGTFAAVVWIVVGALLYNIEPEARLISWQTPVYFVVGMFVAAALFGNLSYATVRGITNALVAAKIVTARTRRAAIGLMVTGYILFALEVGADLFHCAPDGQSVVLARRSGHLHSPRTRLRAVKPANCSGSYRMPMKISAAPPRRRRSWALNIMCVEVIMASDVRSPRRPHSSVSS